MTAKVSHDPARETLRKALAGRDAAKEAVRVASEAATRGKELLQGAEAKLAAFGDVDAAIVEHRAASFKSAARGGTKPSLVLSDDLLKRERGRNDAASAVAAAKAAHTSLVAELEEAEKVIGRAEAVVAEGAATILQEEAIKQAAALNAAWSSVWQLTDVLNALRGVPTALPLPADAIWLLNLIAGFDHRQFAGGRNTALGLAGERWRTWQEALCKSADAGRPDFDGDRAIERVA